MKRFLSLLLAAAVAVSALCVPSLAVGYDPGAVYTVEAESAYIVNTDTNVIIYEKDSEKQVQAKGLTKLMTMALILTNYEGELDSINITMPFAVSDYVQNTTYADVRSNETYTLRQMMYGMMLPNGNDAAQGTAYVLSETDLNQWVEQMNELSQRIGTTGSTWTDACGIDSGNVTTARDMYLILRYLMDFDDFCEIAGTYQYEMPANTKHANSFWIMNTNKMLSKSQGGQYYRSAIKGGKTDVSGAYPDKEIYTQSCVSWASQNGSTYIFSVMNSPYTCDDYGYSTLRPALYETGKLVDWVFDNFAIQSALDTTQPLCEVKVRYSSQDTLKLYPADDLETILPAASDATVTQKIYNLPEYVDAPVKQGDTIGTVTLMLSGEPIGTVALLAGQDISRSTILYTLSNIKAFFTGTYFHVLIVVSIITLIGYLVLFFVRYNKRRKSNKIKRS